VHWLPLWLCGGASIGSLFGFVEVCALAHFLALWGCLLWLPFGRGDASSDSSLSLPMEVRALALSLA
jgi:hypothetical protein